MNPDPDPQPSAPARARTNWSGNIAFAAPEFHRPATIGELRAVVARARQIRVLATGHSFNDMPDSPGAQVSLAGLPPEVEVDSAASRVRVAAGLSYAALAAQLDRHGFALRNLASLPHISVAGACATGTHGSGPANPTLSAAVTAVELVTADGDLTELRRDSAPNPLAGTAPGAFPGTAPGAFPGTAPGAFPGTAPGAFPGTAPGAFPGTAPGAFPGTAPGAFPGTALDAPAGVAPGAFPGAVVHLGALGVVTHLVLEVVPSFDVSQRVYEDLPFEVLDDHFADIMASGYSVSMFTDWRAPCLTQLWIKQRVNPTQAPRTPSAPAVPPASPVTQELWFTARPAPSARNPVPGLPPENCTEQLGVPGRWFERLPHFRPEFTPSAGDELQSEYLLPAAHAVPALRALSRIGDRLAGPLRICEIRMIAADDLWLSPCYQQDSVAFHFTWIRDTEAVLPVVSLIERELAPFGPRPHWGKVFTTPAAGLRVRYQRLPDFLTLMHHYDSAGKFRNAYTFRYLTPLVGHHTSDTEGACGSRAGKSAMIVCYYLRILGGNRTRSWPALAHGAHRAP